jgi:hypothetical protein
VSHINLWVFYQIITTSFSFLGTQNQNDAKAIKYFLKLNRNIFAFLISAIATGLIFLAPKMSMPLFRILFSLKAFVGF